MKMLMAVLLIRTIINLVERDKNKTVNKKERINRVMHPAEFEIR